MLLKKKIPRCSNFWTSFAITCPRAAACHKSTLGYAESNLIVDSYSPVSSLTTFSNLVYFESFSGPLRKNGRPRIV
jgi:hypothetical protein